MSELTSAEVMDHLEQLRHAAERDYKSALGTLHQQEASARDIGFVVRDCERRLSVIAYLLDMARRTP